MLSPAIAGYLAARRRHGGLHAGHRIPGGHARHRHGAVAAATAARTAAQPAPTASFTTASYCTLRLQQILAQLGYLPLSWTPAAGAAVPRGKAAAQLAAAYAPPPGTFRWTQHGYPSSLYSFWSQGEANTLDGGAITGFEADHGLTTDGVASRGRLGGAAEGRRERTSATPTGTATRSPASRCRRR